MGAISKGNAMDVGFISEVILPVVFVIVGIALVWAIVELVLVLRRTRKTVETLETSVKPIIDDVQKVAADAKEMTASIKPAIDRVDPLVERASLAVDAANLEIMRLDGILENVDAITSSAASATEAVDTVANAPLKIVNAASEKLREALSGKKASDESAKLAAAVEAAAPAEFAAIEGDQAAACAPEAHAPEIAAEKSASEPEPQTAGGYFTYGASKED